MYERAVWRPPTYVWALLAAAGLLLTWKLLPEKLEGRWLLLTPVLIGGGVLAVRRLWEAPPAVAMCGAIALSIFSGAWAQIGLANLPLNRLLAVLAILQCLLRAPGTARMPLLRLRNVHLLMALALLYAAFSALAAETLSTEKGFLLLWDEYGVMPFLLFLVAPAIFAGERERDLLLYTLVGLGIYLGITACFEIVGPRALVFPSYIAQSDAIRPGVLRAGGAFQSAVALGCATFVCAVAAAIAWSRWREPWKRRLAAASGLIALAGCFLTLERGVWLAATIATVLAALATRTGRRALLPGFLVAVTLLLGALALSPSLSQSASERATDQRSVWDRENQIAAGVRMVKAKPLFGFGLGEYPSQSRDYFRQPATYPMTGYVPGTTIGVPEVPQPLHSTYLSYAVELGLVGAALWLACFLWAIAEGIFAPGPAALRPWKIGLIAVAAFVGIVVAVNPHEPPFTFVIVLTWAGVALGSIRAERADLPEPAPAGERAGGALPSLAT